MHKIIFNISIISIGFLSLTGTAQANTAPSPFAPIDTVVQKGLQLPNVAKPAPDQKPVEPSATRPTMTQPVAQPEVHYQQRQSQQALPKKQAEQTQEQPAPEPQTHYGISGLNTDENDETDSSSQGFKLHF